LQRKVRKEVARIILSYSFWNNVLHALKIGGPLVKVLRLADGEQNPPMGYLYEAMDPRRLFKHHSLMSRNMQRSFRSLMQDRMSDFIDLCMQLDLF
ncbi:hypothetical protein A4A49_53368, partial [Nicotiana attenuata]